LSVRLMSERDLVRAVMRRADDADDALQELRLRSIGASDEWRHEVAELRHRFSPRTGRA
jgi:hypothetical protein